MFGKGKIVVSIPEKITKLGTHGDSKEDFVNFLCFTYFKIFLGGILILLIKLCSRILDVCRIN